MFPYPLLFSLCVLASSRAVFYFWGKSVGWAFLSVSAVAVLLHVAFSLPQKGMTFIRGRRRPEEEPDEKPAPQDGTRVFWGGEELPAKTATTHFLVAGTTGAGKTLLLNKLMESVFPFIGKCRADGTPFDRRALVYDAKGDVFSTLHQLTDAPVITLHPFDRRGALWDMAQDITTPSAALQMAALLIPQDKQATGNPFFILAAQNLMRGVLLSLMEVAPGDWTFRDVILALRYEERLRQLLDKTLEGRGILDQFFRVGSEALQGVRATLATKVAPYEVIAAAWDRATKRVSLKEFIEGEFVLVLGNDESTRVALDAINQVLFQRLSELILSGSESRTRQTWIFLDEVREAGKLDGLSRLMTKGRSKGACIALGFQAIEGMREVYGNNVAGEITGLCNNKAILLLESPDSAKWASELFGKSEEIDRRDSVSRTQSLRGILPTGRTRARSEHRLTTDSVMASEVMTLPPASPEQGLQGYFITREKGAYKKTVPWGKIGLKKQPEGERIADFVPRPGQDQYLREWTEQDMKRLGIKPLRLAVPDPEGMVSPGEEDQGRKLRPVRARGKSL